MPNTRESLLAEWPNTAPSAGLLDSLMSDSAIAAHLQTAPLDEVRALLAFMLFARDHTTRFADDADPDAPMKWITNLVNADPHRQKTFQMLMMGGINLADEYAQVIRATLLAARADPRSVTKRDGAAYRVAGFSPDNIPTLGGARESAAATWNGILVRELADRVRKDAANRYALIARLASACGADVSRQKVRAILER